MYPVRVLLVRGMTMWENFAESVTRCLTGTNLIDGRQILCKICPSFSSYQLERAFDIFDPTVVIWCRIPADFTIRLKKYHIGKTFILYNWDSPNTFWSRPHMKDIVCEMDHIFTSDKTLTESSIFLLPPPTCMYVETLNTIHTVGESVMCDSNHTHSIELQCIANGIDNDNLCYEKKIQEHFTETFDISICVSTMYTNNNSVGDVILRKELFKSLENSNLSFGLFGPDTELAMFKKSYKGYASPTIFPEIVKSSRLCLNVHQHDDIGYINHRAVNIAAYGGAMITEGTSGVMDHFTHEVNAIIVPKGTSTEEWVRIIQKYVDQDKRDRSVLDTVRKNIKNWQKTNATWSLWKNAMVSCIQSNIGTMYENVLYVKPFCGLCNQLTVVCFAINVAKQTKRRVWVDGFQPSYDIYKNNQRLRFDKMFDLVELSNIFELPIREVPEWFRKDNLYKSWGIMERPSHSKKFKRYEQVLALCLNKKEHIVNGGFLFIPGNIENQTRTFVRSMHIVCRPFLIQTARHILKKLGLVEKEYNAIHMRLETDMIKHLSNRRGKTHDEIKNMLFGKTNEMIHFLLSDDANVDNKTNTEEHTGNTKQERSIIPTFMAYGINMDNTTSAFVESVRNKICGVDSCNYTCYIQENCGKGREIAAIVDLLICINGSKFAGSSISTFSKFISSAYDTNNNVVVNV